ncbi:MAG TPA: phage virion morphogenesis protein [Coleofasciculaceae cyanobacterium]
MEITVKLDDVKVRGQIETIKKFLANPSPALKNIGEYYLGEIDENFKKESGANGKWKPLSPGYALWKSRQPNAIQKKLQFTGTMRAGINYEVTGNQVSIGSDRIYAERQEKNRSFLRPTNAQAREFGAIVVDYLQSLE